MTESLNGRSKVTRVPSGRFSRNSPCYLTRVRLLRSFFALTGGQEDGGAKAIQRAWRRRKLGAAGAILAHLEATSGKHVIRRTFRARNSATGGSADYSEGDDALARMRAGFATASSSARKLEAGGAALGRRLLGRGRSHSDEEDPRDEAAPLARDPPPPPRRASGPGPVDEPPPERDQRSRIFGVMVGDSWVNDVVCYSNGADRDDHVVVCYSNEGEQDERALAKARQQASRLPVEVP